MAVFEQRNLHGDRHGALLQHREHLFAVDLLEDHRHAADDRGLYDGHSLDEDLRRGDAAQQRDVAADGQRCEEVERASVGVGQREEREGAAAALEIVGPGLGVERRLGEKDVAREVVHREHHAFGVSGRSGGVVEQDDAVVRYIGVFDVADAEPAGVFRPVILQDVVLKLGERLSVAFEDDVEVRQREDRLDLADVVLVDHVPEVVAEEEQSALRVVDDVRHVGRREVLEDRDDDGAVGDRGDVGDAPAGIVAADQCNLVALLDSRLLEKQVEFGNLLGHFVVRKGLVLEVVGQRRHFAVLPETGFVYLDQILL